VRTFLTLFLLLAGCSVFAQVLPVRWSHSVTLAAPGHYKMVIDGTIAPGWHLYGEADSTLGLEPVRLSWPGTADDRIRQSVQGNLLDYSDPVFNGKRLRVFTGHIRFTASFEPEGEVPPVLRLAISGFASNDTTFLPFEQEMEVALPGVRADAGSGLPGAAIDVEHPLAGCGDSTPHHGGLATIFLLGFLGGLLALLTPCVFPMIPVTVSFFWKRAENKKAAVRNGLVYGLFIWLIYLLASAPFHLLGGIDKNIFNVISTNAWVNVFFFGLFVLFALSFFGLFEIRLPGALATRADARSSLGNLSGIFFMALTLALVSFSCTGVILGVLLANIATGGAWALTAGMCGFGLALALPFAFFGMFPGLLKSLPKSGGWLESLKKVLAFVELALAFKFLSNADLVEHWGLLKREVFIGVWALIALGPRAVPAGALCG
jgi:cytochrome c biogenesis protein CcdA